MNRHRNRHQKTEHVSKLDEFPEDFDDCFFHNQAVEQDKKIPVLRNIVYKKIKNAIIDRVAEHKNDFPLTDKFVVSFETTGFSEFQWAVIREELQDCGFDPYFEFEEEKKDGEETTTRRMKALHVPIERTISLTETLKEKNDREREEDNGYSSDGSCNCGSDCD